MHQGAHAHTHTHTHTHTHKYNQNTQKENQTNKATGNEDPNLLMPEAEDEEDVIPRTLPSLFAITRGEPLLLARDDRMLRGDWRLRGDRFDFLGKDRSFMATGPNVS